MTAPREVVLVQNQDAEGRYYASAKVTKVGDLQIGGQDLGRVVEAFWGTDLREYEWDVVVSSENVDALVQALGGAAGDDVLDLLVTKFSGPRALGIKSFLQSEGIPFKFSSWLTE